MLVADDDGGEIAEQMAYGWRNERIGESLRNGQRILSGDDPDSSANEVMLLFN